MSAPLLAAHRLGFGYRGKALEVAPGTIASRLARARAALRAALAEGETR